MSSLHHDNSLSGPNLVVRTKLRQDDDEEQVPIHSPPTLGINNRQHSPHSEDNTEFKPISPTSARLNTHHQHLLRKEASNL